MNKLNKWIIEVDKECIWKEMIICKRKVLWRVLCIIKRYIIACNLRENV